MAERYRRQRIRTALTRAGHLVIGQPAGPFGGGGRSDLIVCTRPFGIFGAIEVKDKGEKPTRAQEAFGRQVERAGGFWIVGYEPEEVLRNLELAVRTIRRRAQSIAAPGGTTSTMPIDIDDLFTNPPPPLKAEELDALIDESEPSTSVAIVSDITVTEVTINGTHVDPQLPEAAAKVMGYESAEAREQIDPSPTRKRSSRRVKRPDNEVATPPEVPPAGPTAPQESAEPTPAALSERESTPFDELKVDKADYEMRLERLGEALSELTNAVHAMLELRVTAV